MKQIIEVELPNSGAYAACPSGDSEYGQAVQAAINAALPIGAKIVARLKNRQERIIRDYAVVQIEVPEPVIVPRLEYAAYRDQDGDVYFHRCTNCRGVLDPVERHQQGECESVNGSSRCIK